MFCPKCGRINPDDGDVCKGCSSPLHEAKTVVPKKKFGTVLTAIIVAIAIAVSCFVIASISGCSDNSYEGEDYEVVQF